MPIMKLTRCDNHSDREAVVTICVRILPAGARPILMGIESGARRYFDLCAECRDSVGLTVEDVQ